MYPVTFRNSAARRGREREDATRGSRTARPPADTGGESERHGGGGTGEGNQGVPAVAPAHRTQTPCFLNTLEKGRKVVLSFSGCPSKPEAFLIRHQGGSAGSWHPQRAANRAGRAGMRLPASQPLPWMSPSHRGLAFLHCPFPPVSLLACEAPQGTQLNR